MAFTVLYALYKRSYSLVFVKFVIRVHGHLNFEVLHQFGRSSGILGKHEIGLAQYAYCTKGDILKIAHRSRHYI